MNDIGFEYENTWYVLMIACYFRMTMKIWKHAGYVKVEAKKVYGWNV